jgi:hypothetical protein
MSQIPESGEVICFLQKVLAALQTALLPPPLHAMIYILLNTWNIIRERKKTDLIPATTRLQPGGIGGRDY